MHNKVSCLPPRLLHRVHCRRTSLHFAAPSRVVVLVPVARRNPAHQSCVVAVPPVLHRVCSSSRPSIGRRHSARQSRVVVIQSPVLWASSFRPFFGRHHPVRQSRMVVIQRPVLWASSFRPFFGRRRSARSLGVVILFVSCVWSSSSPSSRRRRSARSWAACLVCCCLDVVFPASCSSMLSVAHLLLPLCSEGTRGRRKSKVK